MKNQTVIYIIIIALVLLVLFWAKRTVAENYVKKINCSSFTSWKYAQKTYDSNPIKYARLDRDKDKVVCESLITNK